MRHGSGWWRSSVAALAAFVVPALHPLLRAYIGAPSHLLWFSATVGVAIISYRLRLRGAVLGVAGTVLWVGVGERAFGAGYGHAADEATIVALMITVGFSALLIAAFSLAARAEQERTSVMEAQLAQANKMEAIGRLAGGVAHDFNNLLTVILSTAHMMRQDREGGVHADDRRASEDLDVIIGAAQSASDLTRQLLAFSRRGTRRLQAIDLNATVAHMKDMVRRLVGDDVTVEFRLAPDAGYVNLEDGQIEQVVMNLVANARDAMPAGGRITIRTLLASATSAARPRGDATPINAPSDGFAILEVADTGVGMDAATRERILEPFFTTKPAGKGTGLGLSTVFAVAHNTGGDIAVRSEPGHGTCVRVRLPLAPPPAVSTATAEHVSARRADGSRHVLVVDDQESVRVTTRRILERAGYRVTTAPDGPTALSAIMTAPRAFDAVVTDLAMPRMSGLELAAEVRRAAPGTSVLIVSGFVAEQEAINAAVAQGHRHLAKPFDASQLTEAVADLIASRMGNPHAVPA